MTAWRVNLKMFCSCLRGLTVRGQRFILWRRYSWRGLLRFVRLHNAPVSPNRISQQASLGLGGHERAEIGRALEEELGRRGWYAHTAPLVGLPCRLGIQPSP